MDRLFGVILQEQGNNQIDPPLFFPQVTHFTHSWKRLHFSTMAGGPLPGQEAQRAVSRMFCPADKCQSFPPNSKNRAELTKLPVRHASCATTSGNAKQSARIPSGEHCLEVLGMHCSSFTSLKSVKGDTSATTMSTTTRTAPRKMHLLYQARCSVKSKDKQWAKLRKVEKKVGNGRHPQIGTMGQIYLKSTDDSKMAGGIHPLVCEISASLLATCLYLPSIPRRPAWPVVLHAK